MVKMTEEDQDSIRPISPYHEKCFPPYCDSAGPVDKQSVSKMNRKDLEDKYIVFADENLNLKKRIREHERQIQRMQTAMVRQDNIDKKEGKTPRSLHLDNARLENLEQQNKHLQAKVKVLKQQLMNHSFIHSKEKKIADNKEKQYKNPESFRDEGRTQSARDKNRYKSPSPSGRDLNNASALKERITLLENQLETQKEKYKARIAQLEKEVAALNKSGGNLNEELSEHSRKVNDNVEIIKLRRDSKKLATQVSILGDENDALRKELEELKASLKKADTSVVELERMLEREREKAKDAKSKLSQSISHTETIRALEEEIRDLKNERKELKEANEQLLLLTTTTSKHDKNVGSESKLKQQISALELKLRDKTKELESKEEEVAQLEALLKDPAGKSPKSVDECQQIKNKLAKTEKELEELRVTLGEQRAIASEHQRNCLKTPAAERERPLFTPRTPPPPTPAPSEHVVEQVPGELATKPMLIIVSKHEFETILMKKKKYHSQTEVMVPFDGQQLYNCKMEICIYDLEVDNRIVEYISEMETEPQVFVVWNFLGLEQSTVAMPLTKAYFHTNVVYFGPLSKDMARHVQQTEMPINLMLVRSDGNTVKIGEGKLDLMPAIDQPNRGFLRSVNLSADRGYANVYCSFKLHSCCLGNETDTSVVETIEVGIGHLELNKYENARPDANHLYVEYSLLGYCGPELETDSVPKTDIMRFNYTKRLKVDESNAKHLEPMINPHHAKALRFLVLSEPCSLAQGTEIEEIGHADLNLMEEMVMKDQDVISKEIPVYDNDDRLIGSLSVTVIGHSTLQNYVEKRRS